MTGRTIISLLLALGVVAPAAALALDDEHTARAFEVRALPKLAAVESHEAKTPIARLREKLRGIPLRPVRIGETPRLPDDPEPGLGLVVHLRF